MVRRGLAVSPLFVCLALATLPACHTRTVAFDGGVEAGAGDAASADAPAALALDFAVTGCARALGGASSPDGGVAPCTGSAPLTLTFSPVGSAALTRFRWTFGDDSPPSSDRAPTHTYVLPGLYDVAVAAEGAAGSLSRARPGFVSVTANAAGTTCDVDQQCAIGLFCLCGESAPCGAAFPRGVCTSLCPTTGCGAGATCARVDVPAATPASSDGGSSGPEAGADAPAEAPVADAAADTGDAVDAAADAGDAAADAVDAAADAPSATDAGASDAPLAADARATDAAAGAGEAGHDAGAAAGDAGGPAPPVPLCLASCVDDDDCATGLVCRTMPGGASGAWANACVPPYYRPVADSCRDAEGRLDDHVCSTGLCADLGAIGLCSAPCSAGAPCPTGTACATFGDGRSLCLLTCSTSASCSRDPLLDCETGAGGGALGFTVSPPAPTATFCAPSACTSAADCGPSGTCKPLGVGAHCVAN